MAKKYYIETVDNGGFKKMQKTPYETEAEARNDGQNMVNKGDFRSYSLLLGELFPGEESAMSRKTKAKAPTHLEV